MNHSPVITIDGPAGSGKSTTAREVARRLGFSHLDSGSLYRALTLAALGAGIPEHTWDELDRDTVARLDVGLTPKGGGFRVLVNGADPGDALRSPEVTRLAPHLARNPWVREKLGELQRSARTFGGIVADGRDMGTVVFPDAVLKVFLTASLEERSRRRLRQEGRPSDEASVVAEGRAIRDRDEADAGRAVGPLRRPDGALVIDTTSLSFEAQVERIVEAASGLTTQLGQE
jgi:cytidylate kinase